MISYVDSIEGIGPEQLRGFFQGWSYPPSPQTHLAVLAGSDRVVLAVDEEIGRVVGVITAISDGVLSAYIPLLEVLPAYRGQGIGTRLLRRMLDRLRHLYMVDLVCDPERRTFYERVGMVAATAMTLRSHAGQAGVRPDSG